MIDMLLHVFSYKNREIFINYAHNISEFMKIKDHLHYLHYHYTVCPRSSDPFYVITYYIKLITTSWTYSTVSIKVEKRM